MERPRFLVKAGGLRQSAYVRRPKVDGIARAPRAVEVGSGEVDVLWQPSVSVREIP